jgi:hypothetical protein
MANLSREALRLLTPAAILVLLAGSSSLCAQERTLRKQNGQPVPPNELTGNEPILDAAYQWRPKRPKARLADLVPPALWGMLGIEEPPPLAKPLAEMLPKPPKHPRVAGPILGNNLERVPEVVLGQAQAQKTSSFAEMRQQIINIRQLNKDCPDGFMQALLIRRTDLSGLPVVMGDAARMEDERRRHFQIALNAVRVTPGNFGGGFGGGFAGYGGFGGGFGGSTANDFWNRFVATTRQHDQENPKADETQRDNAARARVAVLMQVMPAEPAAHRKGLVSYLGSVPHVEATRALAKLAIFSTEAEVRDTAIDHLRVRRDKDYTDVLLKGLRYPWPAVAKRAAETLAKLQVREAIPRMIDALEIGDPRLPVRKYVSGEEVWVVRELVKMNHNRNCLLCHGEPMLQFEPLRDGPPSVTDMPVGVIPIPGRTLPQGAQRYSPRGEDMVVRVDVTHLRQDFSLMLPVPDAAPWPNLQRFDFLVRTRVLSDEDAAVYRQALEKDGAVRPYRDAIVAALRKMTGYDAEPTAAAWRKLLRLAPPAGLLSAAP